MKERIHQIMKESGMNQKEFSQATGIPTATLSNIFNGRTSATLNHALALHRRFPNLRMEWLLFGEGEPYLSGSSSESAPESFQPTFDSSGLDYIVDTPSTETPMSDVASTVSSHVANSETPVSALSCQGESVQDTVRNVNKPTRKIVELRVFFDDGTYEVFSKG